MGGSCWGTLVSGALLCWGPAAPAGFCRKLSAASVSSWPQIGLVGPRSTPTWQALCTEVTAWGRGRLGVCWLLLPHASSSSREWPRRSLCWRQAGTASPAPSPSSRLCIAGCEGDWYSPVGMWGLVRNPGGYSKGLIPKLCICTLHFGDKPGDSIWGLSSSTAPGMLVVIGAPY